APPSSSTRRRPPPRRSAAAAVRARQRRGVGTACGRAWRGGGLTGATETLTCKRLHNNSRARLLAVDATAPRAGLCPHHGRVRGRVVARVRVDGEHGAPSVATRGVR